MHSGFLDGAGVRYPVVECWVEFGSDVDRLHVARVEAKEGFEITGGVHMSKKLGEVVFVGEHSGISRLVVVGTVAFGAAPEVEEAVLSEEHGASTHVWSAQSGFAAGKVKDAVEAAEGLHAPVDGGLGVMFRLALTCVSWQSINRRLGTKTYSDSVLAAP